MNLKNFITSYKFWFSYVNVKKLKKDGETV